MEEKCSICGGEVKNGVCCFCGQKNVIVQQVAQKQTIYQAPMHDVKKKNTAVVVVIIIAVLAFILILGVGVFAYQIMGGFGDYSNEMELGEEELAMNSFQFHFTQEPTYGSDTVDEVLAQGTYIVGVHIPEGKYQLETEGYGELEISDTINRISYSQFYYEYETSRIEDVILCNGAVVRIEDVLDVTLKSSNANKSTMTGIVNVETETYKLTEKRQLTVGEDLLPGIYDLTMIGEYGTSVHINVPGYSNIDESVVTSYIRMNNYEDSKESEKVNSYKNLVLPEGTVLESTGEIILAPSPMTAEIDLIDHYENYMYQEYVQYNDKVY